MKIGSLPRRQWPQLLRHPKVQGVFVGGCVDRGIGYRFRHMAHAHIVGPYLGWICFRSGRHVDRRELLLHELAHVVTQEGHTRTWREYLLAIGGTLKAVPGLLRAYQATPPVWSRRS